MTAEGKNEIAVAPGSPQEIDTPPTPAEEGESPILDALSGMLFDSVKRIRVAMFAFSWSKPSASADAIREDIEKLRLEAERQEVTARMAEVQSKLAHEIAIARRIEMSEEVEMEEYYDNSVQGHAGARSDGKTFSLGVSGDGKRMSKRVFRFKGILAIYKKRVADNRTE